MNIKSSTFIILGLAILGFAGFWTFKKFNFNFKNAIGQPVDSLNGIYVYYNGGVSNVSGRNLTLDNYNLGLKYQCVEFVKRYYYMRFNHKMPNSSGNAKDLFDPATKDGNNNAQRDLTQFKNPSQSKPRVDDLLIYSGTVFNNYGHVAIVSKVTDNEIEVIQQNPGPFSKSRETFSLEDHNDKWLIQNKRILGWLRKD